MVIKNFGQFLVISDNFIGFNKGNIIAMQSSLVRKKCFKKIPESTRPLSVALFVDNGMTSFSTGCPNEFSRLKKYENLTIEPVVKFSC